MSEENSKCGCEGGTGFCKCPGSTGSVVLVSSNDTWQAHALSKEFDFHSVTGLTIMRSTGWKWWRHLNTKGSGSGRRFRLNLYKRMSEHGEGACFTSLKYFWWLMKYGEFYSEEEQGAALEELARAANADNVKQGTDQIRAVKAWQEKYAKKKNAEPPGDGGAYYLGPGFKPHATLIDLLGKWSTFVDRLRRLPFGIVADPCCVLQLLVHTAGTGVLLSVEASEPHDAALMIIAVDCLSTPKCKVVVMDWDENAGEALIDFERGTIKIDNQGVFQPGGFPSSEPFGAGGTHRITGVSIHN